MSDHAPLPALRGVLTRLGHLFYIHSPHKLALAADESAVDIAGPATPMFFVLIGLEYAWMALRWPDRVPFRLNDVLTSAGLGVAQTLFLKVLSQVVSLEAPYKFIYNNYRLVDLDVKKHPLVTWLNFLYQFWIHTEAVGSLGVLEHVLNTPRHHRMHHRPPGNRNYAGVLIIWDRLFGTFEAEAERLDYYGLAKSPETFDAVQLNVQHWRKMALIPGSWCRRLFTLRAKHALVIEPKALLEPLPPIPWEPPSEARRPKHDGAGLSAPRAVLALGAFALAVACMELAGGKSKRRTAAIAGAGVLSLHAMGKLLDTGSIASFVLPEALAVLALSLGLRGPLGA